MKLAYMVEVRYGVNVVEFSYEQETPRMLMGCSLTRQLIGSYKHVGSRVHKGGDNLCFTSQAAFARAIELVSERIASAKRDQDGWTSRLGEIEKVKRESEVAA